MQIQDFYSDSMQLDLRPLFSSFNFRFEVPLFQGFDYKKKSKKWRFLSVKKGKRWCFPKASSFTLSLYVLINKYAFRKHHLLLCFQWHFKKCHYWIILTMTLVKSVIFELFLHWIFWTKLPTLTLIWAWSLINFINDACTSVIFANFLLKIVFISYY